MIHAADSVSGTDASVPDARALHSTVATASKNEKDPVVEGIAFCT